MTYHNIDFLFLLIDCNIFFKKTSEKVIFPTIEPYYPLKNKGNHFEKYKKGIGSKIVQLPRQELNL